MKSAREIEEEAVIWLNHVSQALDGLEFAIGVDEDYETDAEGTVWLAQNAVRHQLMTIRLAIFSLAKERRLNESSGGKDGGK